MSLPSCCRRGRGNKMAEIAGVMRPIGLLALIGLIPFIILYLRRPKPKDQIIPSLMFIMQDQQKSKKYAFFRRLVHSLLFLIQMIIILCLAISAAAPFVKLPYDVTLENTVLIIDVSASMQAVENGISRFDKAMEAAEDSLSGRNTIILAENTPLIALEEESNDVAMDVLSKIKPKATATNLGDSLLLAKDILGDNPGRIVVFSDFLSTDGPDVKVVKTAITTDDRIVDFVDVSNKANNVGIIKSEIDKYTSRIYIKNFNPEEKTIKIKIYKDGTEITSSDPIKLAPNSIESCVFETVPGTAKVEITPSDSLAVDNFVFIATPPKLKNNVLLITNEKTTNLQLALESAKDIHLNVVNPPVLTVNTKGEKINPYKHDVIIVYKINNVNKKDGILPGTFQDIRDYVKKGGNLIITAQDDIAQINMEGIEPVKIKSIVSDMSTICVDSVNEITKIFKIDECFTTTSKYIEAEAKKDSFNLGIYSSNRKSAPPKKDSIITFQKLEKGKVAFYGIFDEASDFKTLPSYPILWDSLINFMAGAEDIRDFNFKTGRIAAINEQKVTTPSSSYTTSKLLMDEAGIYEYDGKKYAANLLDDKESDIASSASVQKQEEREQLLGKTEKERDFNMEFAIILLAFLLLSTEMPAVLLQTTC